MDERYKLIIDGGTENAFTKEYTKEELESKKDYIDQTYGGRYKVETIGDADTSAIDDAASYTVSFDDSDFTKTYTGAEFKSKKDYLDQTYGGRYHVSTTLGSYDNMRDLFPSLGEQLDTFRMEHRDFMNDIEARREAAIEASKNQEAMRPDSMKTTSYAPITDEEWSTYSDLAKQEEALKKAYYTSDEYLRKQNQKAFMLSQMQEQLQADIDLYASENPMIIGGAAFVPNPAVSTSRGVQEDEEMRNYDTARRILNETIKLQNAPSKYDASTGIRNMAVGAGDELTNAALWTAGLSEMADNLNIRGVLSKVQSELGNLSDLSEEKIESILTPAEKAVLQAWAINAQTQIERAADLSRGYQAGKGAVESLGFMAEFALTGGVGKATAEGAETFAKWLGKKLFSASDEVAGKMAKEVAEEAGEGIIKKYAKNLGLSLAEAAGRTGVMPSTFRNITDKAVEIEKGEDGELRLIGMNRAFVKGLADSFIENLSEGGRVNALGGLVGDTLNRIPKWSQFTDWLSHTKAGSLYTALNSSGIMNTLRAGGWHGIGEEYLEEWYGNAIRTITGVDKDALREFATRDNQMVTIASFLPLTIFGGTVSTAQVRASKKRLDAASEAWMSALQERAYGQAQAKQNLDILMMSSPAEMGKIIDSIVAKEAETNLGAAARLSRAGADLMKSIIKWQAFNTKYKAQEADQRKAVRDRLSESMQGKKWWMTDEKGKETVMRATNDKGDVIFVTGKPSEPGQKAAGVTADGNVAFFNADEYQMEGEVSMDTFLGNEVMAEKADKEKARMLAEKDAAIAEIKKKSAPGMSVVIGTAEARIPGTIVKRYVDGVAIETAEGVVMMTYEQLGNYVGENAIPLTDDQLDNQEADVILAKDAQREADLDAEYGELDSAVEKEEEAVNEAKEAIEIEESLPMDSEGNVDEQALWNENPAKWATWNDAQRQDGGANSMLAVNAAMNALAAEIAEAEAAYASMPVGTQRNAVEQDINAKKGRLQQLNDIAQSYAVQAEAVAVEQQIQASATSQMSEQQKEQIDAQYESIYGQTRSLNEKARLLQEYLDKISEGTVPVIVLTQSNYAQAMKNAGCPDALIRQVAEALSRPGTIEGFMAAGKAFLVAEGIPSIDKGRQKYIHERQHVFARNTDYVRRILATGVTREQLQKYVRDFSTTSFYDNMDNNVLADELLSFAMEIVHTYEDFSVVLQNRGLSEDLINIIKSIDDEQSRTTNAERLSQARRRRRSDYNDGATSAGNNEQDGRNSEQVSRGVLEQQDAGSLEFSFGGAGDREAGEAGEAGEGEQVNPAFVEAISTTEQDAEFSQLIDEKAFEDPKPIDGIESDDVRYSILKEEEMRKSTQSYYDKHYKGGKLSASDKKRVPLDLTHFTQELLDAANAQIQELWEHMRPYLDMESKGKRFLPAEVYGKSTLFDNASYGKTMENTLICTRTLAYIDFVEEVKKKIGRPLTATESFLASQMLYDIAIDPQCLYCYVSLDRKAYDEFLLKYAQQRDEVIAKWNESDKSAEAKDALYKEFLNGRKPTAQMQARFESWLLLSDGGATTLEDLATKARRGEIKIGEVPEAWVKASAKYKKLKKDKKLAYAASEEYQSALWEYLASPAGQVTDAEAYAQSASWAKKEEDYRSYTGELLKCSADALRGLMGHYGLRFYSFSEYSPAFILENMQMVRDAAARGLKGFAYTKEIDFIKIFAPTGMNINCSVYGRVDSEGNVVPDTKQGADWAQVQALREQHPNVGAVFVATNDEMVEWALNQPWIDVIIPFHIVRTGADIAKFYDWTNYSSMQSDTTDEGKSGYVYPHEHLNDKETFLRITAERGWKPRFADVKLSDGRSIVEHPNYMRLVNETRRRADETPILTPTFNTKAAKESFDAFVEKGGYYSGYFVEEGAFEQGVETVVEDIKAGKTAKEVDYGRQDVPIDVAKIMAKRAELERKHGKSSAVDTKDIIEAAKASLEEGEEKVRYSVRESSMDEMDSLFKEYNTDETLSALYDKVSGLAHTLDLKIKFDNPWSNAVGTTVADKVKFNAMFMDSPHQPAEKKAHAILHELIHATTQYAIQANKAGILTEGMTEAVNQLESIYNEIKADPAFEKMKGAESVHEMVAELSDAEFRAALKEKNLFQQIVDAIKRLLGIETGENALDNLSSTLDYILENFDADAYRKYVDVAQKKEGYVRFSAVSITPEVREEMDRIAANAIIDGNYMLAPNGQPTKLTADQWAMVRTQNFINWFGDWINDPENASKVVDENGEPMVVYHGTRWNPYDEPAGEARFVSGWFTGMKRRAEGFGEPVAVFLNLRNPAFSYDGEAKGESSFLPDTFDLNNPKTFGEYDGYISYVDYPAVATMSKIGEMRIKMLHPDNYEEVIKEMLAAEPTGRQIFSAIPRYPNQIKSAVETTGEFSESGDIRFSTHKPVGGNSGYVGYSMSKRAAWAREEGRFPKTDFRKEYGVTEKALDALVKAGIINNSEWHHTSVYGNKTTFYGWDEDYYAGVYTEKKSIIDKLAREGKTDEIEAIFNEHPITLRIERERERRTSKAHAEHVRGKAIREAHAKFKYPAVREQTEKIKEAIAADERVSGNWFNASNGVSIRMDIEDIRYPEGATRAEKNAMREEARKELSDLRAEAKANNPIAYDEEGYNAAIAEAEKQYQDELQKLSEEYKDLDTETSDFNEASGTRFSVRTKPEPKETQPVYKLMRLGADGKLYPLFIGSAEAIELGIWYDADSPNLGDLTKLATGVHIVNNETGEAMTLEEFKAEHPELGVTGKRPNVDAINWATANGMRWIEIEDKEKGQKRYGGEARSYFNLGINGSGQVGQFAMRPGWHAGSLPTMRQIGKGSDKYLRDDSFVWVKGRVPADIDYQAEADANPDKDIPTHIPADGYYMKATNANAAASQADRVGWYVAGSFIADEIISDEEARRVITEWNEEHPDAQVKYDFRRESGMDYVPGAGMVETTLAPAKKAEDVVAEGLNLTDQEFARLAGEIFAALPKTWRKGLTDKVGNILDMPKATMQTVTRLAEKENWSEREKELAKDIRNILMDILDPSGIDIDRPLTTKEALWMLYNALEKETDMISEAKRSVVAHNLGFDIDTLAKEAEAKEEVRFSARRNAKAEATARMYNKAATNVWTRLKETFVDMFAAVEDLVKAIEKASGKVAEGFENIILALNQQSSRGFAAMEKYEREFLEPMLDEVEAIMNSTGMTYEGVVRYVILKHGLERNELFAKRDAREFYEAEFRQKVASIRADEKLTDKQKKAQEAQAEKELDQHITDIEWGIDAKYKELREKDYSGITSMFYDQLDVKREDYDTEEAYQSAIVRARKNKYDNLADVEAAADREVKEFEGLANTDALWEKINASTKEILRQQYEASMISKESYEKLKDMFKFYVPLRGFKDNTAEDMYTYYQSPNSTGYTKPILAAEGRSTEAESPFGWIASMASSAIASNVKNEARLALYYFIANRPDNGLATLSKTWYAHTPGDVTPDGKKIFRPSYPPLTPDMTAQEAKEATAKWQQSMEAARAMGNAYESGKKLNLGDSVVNISDASIPEHAVKVKVGGKDYVIFVNGNPRAAQAINGNLNIETSEDYSKVYGKLLRWMSSVNTSYNPEFWVTNMQRDMLFTLMAINTKEDPEYRRKFAGNYAKAFKVIKMAARHEKGTLGDAYLEEMYRQFVENGGVTGYTQIKDNEIWEQEIADYMKSKDKERQKMGMAMKKAKDGLHKIHRFGESLEQVSRFAAFLTSREMGRSMAESISDAKEITVNFNRKGSGRWISPSEARTLTDKNGQPLNGFEQFLVSAISSISPIGRRFIMFFNAAIQGLNATYKLYKANPAKMIGVWSLGYMAVGVMNALLHDLMDDDDDYLDMPQYERRRSLMLGADGFYFKWAIPQEAKVFYALGDIFVEQALGRNPQKWHQEGSALREAIRETSDVLPVNPAEGLRGMLPSILVPLAELWKNEDYKGQPIYRESKWMSEEENVRTARWARAYEGTGMAYVGLSKLLNNLTGGDARDAGIINIPPEAMEHIVQSSFGGTIRTLDKFVTSIVSALDQEVSEKDEPFTLRQTPFLSRLFVLNDERFRNAHVNEMYDYYKAEAEHAKKLEKGYKEDRDMKKASELRRSKEYRWARIYERYKKPVEKKQEQVYEAKSGKERKRLQNELDALKKRMVREMSQQ